MKRIAFGDNRPLGYLLLLFVYAFAAAVGVGVYILLPLDFWLSLLLADVAATLVVFFFSLIFENASVYDPYWSVQPIVILIGFAISKGVTLVMVWPFLVILLWGVRLTANWAYTFKGLGHEDWRYSMLREKTGKLYFFVNLFGIHLVPTLVVYGCVMPAVCTFVYDPPFQAGSVVFFAVSLLAVVLQGTADCEMHAFRRRKEKGFIRHGLWKYSRHPNYLGEIVMWWGVGLAALCAMPHLWYLLAGALANTLLFLFASIPLADGHQARKEGFADYKKNTRMLLPVYKKQR